MGLQYPIQVPVALIGTKNTSTFAMTPVALTTSYTDNRKAFESAGMSKLDIRYSYTSGAAETNNTISILVEQSEDLVNWFTIVNESVSGGTSTVTARTFVNADNTGGATNIMSSIGLDVFYENIRVSFKEGGVAANAGTVYAEATLLGR